MKINQQKHNQLKKFGLIAPVLLIGLAAFTNAYIGEPGKSSASQVDAEKKNVIVSVPDAKTQDISEKDKAMENIFPQDTASNRIPTLSEPQQNNVTVNPSDQSEEMKKMLAVADGQNFGAGNNNYNNNTSRNEDVPSVIYTNSPSKPERTKKEKVVNTPAEPLPEENTEKVDPYAPNKPLTIGSAPGQGQKRKYWPGAVLSEAWVIEGDAINIRNTEEITGNGFKIARNTVLNGTVNIQSGRLYISVPLDEYGAEGKYIEIVDGKGMRGLKVTGDKEEKQSTGGQVLDKASEISSMTGVGTGIFSRIRNISGAAGTKAKKEEYQVPSGLKLRFIIKDSE